MYNRECRNEYCLYYHDGDEEVNEGGDNEVEEMRKMLEAMAESQPLTDPVPKLPNPPITNPSPPPKPPTGWAAIAAKPGDPLALQIQAQTQQGRPDPPRRTVRIPASMWSLSPPDPSAFNLPPYDRYLACTSRHPAPEPLKPGNKTAIIDLHYQSTSSFAPLLSSRLPLPSFRCPPTIPAVGPAGG